MPERKNLRLLTQHNGIGIPYQHHHMRQVSDAELLDLGESNALWLAARRLLALHDGSTG